MQDEPSPQGPPDQPLTAVEAVDALAIANQLRPILMRLYRYLRSEAHELGVTSTQASLLGAIQRTPNVGLGELAAQEHISAPTLVTHINKLEAAGLVERTRTNPQDRRRVDLSLTIAGAQTLQTLRERRTVWLATRLESLSPEALVIIAAAIEPLRQLARHQA